MPHMPSQQDEHFMRRAVALAEQGDRDPGGSPIGCVIVRDGEIIGEAYNLTVADHDPTAHAEIVAMRRAGARLGNWELRGATLYTTLQPCGMCTMASIWAKIGRIAYGAGRSDVHPMYFEDRHLDTADFISDAFRDDLVIEGGFLMPECKRLYFGPHDDVPADQRANV